ncbi:hypothetical protein MJ561_05975 [Klebsiella pneumoniae]|nr:hypothetical protein MJ561_05975 [Klebsiella pneumoniae]
MTADIAHTLHPHRQLLVASAAVWTDGSSASAGAAAEQDPSLTLRACSPRP